MKQSETNPVRRNRAFFVFVIGFYAGWILRVVFLLPFEQRLESEWARMVCSEALKVALWVVPVVVFLKCVDRVGPLSFLKINTLPRGRRMVSGVAIIAGFLGLCVATALLFQGAGFGKMVNMGGAKWFALLWGMTMIAVTEEVFFRGFVFQKLRETQSFHRTNLMTSGLFLLIHWPGWLYMQGFHWGLLRLSVSIVIIAWVLGLLFEVTRSLWPPIVLHFANNVLSAMLLP